MEGRLQGQIQAQPSEAGDEQPGLRAAHSLPDVHGREPGQRLGGGPTEALKCLQRSTQLLSYSNVGKSSGSLD